MLMFTLAVSFLTTSNLLWLMDLTFRIKPHTCQRHSEGSNKPCVHQDPETPPRELRQNCVWVSPVEVQVSRCPNATGDHWRNNSRKNEGVEPKQKQYPAVDVTGDGSKVWCCKEQYRIGTWNVRSMNQGKLERVKQEMARVNITILGISKLNTTGMGEFNSDDHYIYYCGQESLRRNGIALIVNKRVWNAVLEHSLKNDRMISVCFQGKPLNITVIKVHARTSNAEEAEVEWFYEDLQDLLELTPKKIFY